MLPDEKLLSQAAKARLIHLNEEVIVPWLQANIETRLGEACEASKTGVVQLGAIAYIAACRDLLLELRLKAGQGDRAQAKLQQE